MSKYIFDGKENSVTAFASILDREAVKTALRLCKEDAFADSQICLMPNVSADGPDTIHGLTMTLDGTVIPELLGDDLGCGVMVVELADTEFSDIDDETFQNAISRLPNAVPKAVSDAPRAVRDAVDISKLRCPSEVAGDNIEAIDSLGSDVRFAELDKGDAGRYYLVIKAGSSVVGRSVSSFYASVARGSGKPVSFALASSIFERGGRWDAAKDQCQGTGDIPMERRILTGQIFDDFLNDCEIVQKWAFVNRSLCADEVVKFLGLHEVARYDCPENFIDRRTMILRNDAISAECGQVVVIPLNAEDGCLLCSGRGNREWNVSAPACAGRILNNDEAEELLGSKPGACRLKVFPNKQAYKPAETLLDSIRDTVVVEDHLAPVFSYGNSYMN